MCTTTAETRLWLHRGEKWWVVKPGCNSHRGFHRTLKGPVCPYVTSYHRVVLPSRGRRREAVLQINMRISARRVLNKPPPPLPRAPGLICEVFHTVLEPHLQGTLPLPPILHASVCGAGGTEGQAGLWEVELAG